MKAHPQKEAELREWWKQASPLLRRNAPGQHLQEDANQRRIASPANAPPSPATTTPPTASASIAGAGAGSQVRRRRKRLHHRRLHPRLPLRRNEAAHHDVRHRPLRRPVPPHRHLAQASRRLPARRRPMGPHRCPPDPRPPDLLPLRQLQGHGHQRRLPRLRREHEGHLRHRHPRQRPQPFPQGDWMIRVELDQLKEADALRGN